MTVMALKKNPPALSRAEKFEVDGKFLIERSLNEDGEVVEKRTRISDTPAMKLKRLRERAGYTMAQTADYLHFAGAISGGGRSTYNRYEDVSKIGSRKIRYVIVEKLLPFFVGRGSPAITEDELIPLAAQPRAEAPKNMAATWRSSAMQGVVAPIFGRGEKAHLLTVEYRAEKGVYMDDETVEARSFGTSNIGATSDYKDSEQIVVLVADNHAGAAYVQGAQLHCVRPTAFSPKELVGRRVAVKVAMKDFGLAEIMVGQVQSATGNSVTVVAADGTKLDGEVLGVVIGQYFRE